LNGHSIKIEKILSDNFTHSTILTENKLDQKEVNKYVTGESDNNSIVALHIRVDKLREFYAKKLKKDVGKAFDILNELPLNEIQESEEAKDQTNEKEADEDDNNLLGKKRAGNIEDKVEIPKEITLLSKSYTNYSINLNTFNKYRFYKKYCEATVTNE
jgi:hypothetical protein